MIKAKRKLREKLKKTANVLLIKCSLEKGDWAQILLAVVSFYTSQSGKLNRIKIPEIDFKASRSFIEIFKNLRASKLPKPCQNPQKF